MTRCASASRGFTLIELAVALGLFSMLLSGSLAGAAALGESARRAEAEAALAFEGAYLLDLLARGIEVSHNNEGVLFAPGDPDPLTRLKVSSLSRVPNGTRGSSADPARIDICFTLEALDAAGRSASRSFSRTVYENAP